MNNLRRRQKLVDDRYEIGLLWAEENATVQNNYFSGHSQFCSSEGRLETDQSLKQRYEETINVDVQNGYIRSLEENELNETKDERQWYVTHHPVISPHKPKKVRRLCNAAAKNKGESLSDKLLTGPDLLQSPVGINFRFKEHQIALTADIEAMFLQIKLQPQECKVLRLLRKGRPDDKVGVYQYTRHVIGAKSSLRCANYALLQAGIVKKEGHQLAAKAIQRNF